MGIKTIKTWRRLTEAVQALIVIGLPFVTIKGNSALRFDLSSLKLHFFGHSIWMQEFFLVLIALMVLAALFTFVTHVFGRVWCGWACPQTVISDITSLLDRAKDQGFLRSAAAHLLTFAVCVLVAASLIWYFVSPYAFIPALAAGRLGPVVWGFWLTLTAILYLNFAFIRHKWCKSICPYAMLQSVMFDSNTLLIELHPARARECIDCSACLRVCPTGMDIRKGFDQACINCAQCIDACNQVMAPMKKKGLIGYAFGAGSLGRIVRKSSLVLAALTLLFALFFAYLVAARTGVDVVVLPSRIQPRITREQMVLNAYVLSVKNSLDIPLDLVLKVEAPGASPVQSLTAPIHLDADHSEYLPLFVRIGKTQAMKTVRLKLTFTDAANHIEIKREANFVVPNEL